MAFDFHIHRRRANDFDCSAMEWRLFDELVVDGMTFAMLFMLLLLRMDATTVHFMALLLHLLTRSDTKQLRYHIQDDDADDRGQCNEHANALHNRLRRKRISALPCAREPEHS